MRRILHIVGTMGLGGIEQFLMNIYRNIDREEIQFDFVVHSNEKNYFEEEILSLGGKMFKIPRKSKNIFANMTNLYKLLTKNKDYQIIHIHSNSAIILTDLIVAKLARVKISIVHSHSTSVSKKKKIFHKIFKRGMNKLADYKFACSNLAAKWLFCKEQNVQIINNAIDTYKYVFNKTSRDTYRKEFNLKEDVFVLGHVGSFTYAKNHDYLLDVMNSIINKDAKTKLVIVGDGPNRQSIVDKINKFKMQDHIILTGLRDDIPEILSMMDIIVFPSHYEGFPVTIVEAQTSGLKCIVSDTITEEIKITDLVFSLSIDINPNEWAINILDNKNYPRLNQLERVKNAGFDIKDVAEKLQNFYLSLIL